MRRTGALLLPLLLAACAEEPAEETRPAPGAVLAPPGAPVVRLALEQGPPTELPGGAPLALAGTLELSGGGRLEVPLPAEVDPARHGALVLRVRSAAGAEASARLVLERARAQLRLPQPGGRDVRRRVVGRGLRLRRRRARAGDGRLGPRRRPRRLRHEP